MIADRTPCTSTPGVPARPVPSPIVFLSGAGRTKGRRNYMEDVDFIFESVRVTDKRSVGVYGVLDGHGGKECGESTYSDSTHILFVSEICMD